jgi:hypothetical protein
VFDEPQGQLLGQRAYGELLPPLEDRTGPSSRLSDPPGDASGDTIVVWRLDRLGRSVVHFATLADDLRAHGVGLRSLTDGVDTSTATGRLAYGLLSTLAVFERETMVDRTTIWCATR